jgi:isoquinoline 1-oxidoreductase beta subunit
MDQECRGLTAALSLVAEIAHQLGRYPKDLLLELIGPARIVDVSKQVTTAYWNNGEPIESHPIDTGRLRHVIDVAT